MRYDKAKLHETKRKCEKEDANSHNAFFNKKYRWGVGKAMLKWPNRRMREKWHQNSNEVNEEQCEKNISRRRKHKQKEWEIHTGGECHTKTTNQCIMHVDSSRNPSTGTYWRYLQKTHLRQPSIKSAVQRPRCSQKRGCTTCFHQCHLMSNSGKVWGAMLKSFYSALHRRCTMKKKTK